ncbi:MAG: MFS transporter [Clostridia bacterium]|nr:MFS transporter [Clostridia bacterium]
MTYEQKPCESRLSSSKWLFVLCFLVYSAVYIARGNLSYVRTTMIADGILTEGLSGTLSAVYFGCYAVGQIVNGSAADKRPPFLLVSIGLCVIAVTNAAMMFSVPAAVRIIIWAINGFGQSMLWCPVFYIISNVLHPKLRFTAITVITLCTPVGKASCAWISGFALSFGKWQNVFLAASSIIAVIAVLWISASITMRKDLVIPHPECKKSEDSASKKRGLFGILSESGVIFMLPAMLVYGLFLNGVLEVMPSILSKQYSLSSTLSAFLDSFIPLLGSLGVLVSNLLYIKLFKRNDMKSAAFVMAMSMVPMAVMLLLTCGGGFRFGRYADSIVLVITYGLVYILQLSFGHFCVSLVPVKFSGFAYAATVSGIANAIGYGGSAISSYAMNFAVEKLPLWQTVIIWMLCLVAGTVFMIPAMIKWNKFVKNSLVDK